MAKARRHGRQQHLRAGAPSPTPSGTAASGSAVEQVRYVSFDDQLLPESWPSVSLCMIVRNEEAYLADCLRSVGDLASETIIVDTGSTDRTVEIARSFGAEVRHFRWVDDFAAARNESIRDAKGDWILWMDADDRLSAEELLRVKAVLVHGDADVYVFRVVGRIGGGESTGATLHSRLFRRQDGLLFVGRLHERLVAPAALRVARTNIVVEHVGYGASDEVLRAKAERNRRILLQCLADEPDSLYWSYHLGVCAYMLGDWQDAVARLQPVVDDPPATLDREGELSEAHWLLVAACTRIGRFADAERALDAALAAFPRRRQMWVTAGAFHLDTDRPDLAVADLKHALSLPEGEPELGTSRRATDGPLMLSRALLLLGDVAGAREAYLGSVTERSPVTALAGEDALARAAALHAEGRHHEVYALLAPQAHTDARALGLLAESAVAMADWSRAADYRSRAICLGGASGAGWAGLAGLYLKAGNTAAAGRFCDLALNCGRPDVSALNLRAVLAMLHRHADEAVHWLAEAMLVDPGHTPAQDNLRALGLAPTDALRTEGLARLRSGDAPGAAVAFAALVAQSPDLPESYKLLAAALKEAGREDDALLSWQTATLLEATSCAIAG